ncbi:P-loop containing nucleoside triphosphate hydrolase protein [Hyaloraphidium curvatum]|nr:P-loop containing nucleoside triphosphate hydrolase protein [Hyaloraphidium curvatum]
MRIPFPGIANSILEAKFAFFAASSADVSGLCLSSKLRFLPVNRTTPSRLKSKKAMPPKKTEVVEKPPLGRPGNNLKIGIVGLPNVGKSSTFNALTNSSANAANFPFCTIDPEEARCAVPDPRFDWLCQTYKPASKVPAYLTVIDIAGLVKGASEGQGLGNAFLSHVRAVDGIFHVVRCFDDDDVVHVNEEGVDPVRDLQDIREELRLKDEAAINKQVEELGRVVARLGTGGTAQDKAKKEEFETLKKIQKCIVDDKKEVRQGDWSAKDIEVINSLYLLTAKPVIVLCNLSEKDFSKKKNKWLAKIKQWVDTTNPGDLIIPYSVVVETKYASLTTDDERAAYAKELAEKHGVDKPVTSALPKIIVAGYQALQLQYFFTAGEDEVRAWTIRKGTKAPQAAGVIHTDFERGFIMAEVMKYEDLHELETESAVKAAGKYVQKGKDYVVQDGDIIYFKFNVTAPQKKK